jgi:hypothetical protein
MSANVDVEQALELLAKLQPELLAYESAVTRDLPDGPSLDDGEALDRALRAGLARLRVEIGRETFIYLRWRAERARAAAAATRAAAAASRGTARVVRGATERTTTATEREVRDALGRLWTVSEVVPNDLLGSASPRWLVFRRGAGHRQTSDYPPDWRARSDHELCRLLTLGDSASDVPPDMPDAR